MAKSTKSTRSTKSGTSTKKSRKKTKKKRPGWLRRFLVNAVLKGLIWGFAIPLAYLAIAPPVSRYLSKNLHGWITAFEWPKELARFFGLRKSIAIDFWFVVSYVLVGATLGFIWGLTRGKRKDDDED